MVTTRGKRIKFNVGPSGGEDNDVEFEGPGKQVDKPQRTVKSASTNVNAAFHPSGASSSATNKANATPNQTHLITRRSSRGGKLRNLMNMPIDVFVEVCSYLEPHDLRRVALTSRRLWDILMTKESRHIWNMALEAVDLPPCPRDLNEPQYVCLIFSSECYSVGCSGRGTKVDWFHRVRHCPPCHEVKMTTAVSPTLGDELTNLRHENAFSVVQKYFDSDSVLRLASRGGPKKGTDEKRFLISTLRKAVTEYAALVTKAERLQYRMKLKEECDYRTKTGEAMLEWKSKQVADRTKDIAEGKHARFERIKVNLLEMGWDERDFPMENKEFVALVLKDQQLTPRIWQNVHSKLEPLLHAARASRLQEEKQQRLCNRVAAIGYFYHEIGKEVMDLPLKLHPIDLFLPDLEDILKLPSVNPLVEADTETVTEEQWIDVASDVRMYVLKWWWDCLKKATDTLGGRKAESEGRKPELERKNNDAEEETDDAITAAIEALRAQMAYTSPVFVCGSPPSPTIKWFPQLVDDASHSRFKIEEKLISTRPLSPAGKELMTRVLRELGFEDSGMVKWADVEDDSRSDYLCTRCDVRIARYMTFSKLVSTLSSFFIASPLVTLTVVILIQIAHFLGAKQWHDEATEAMLTDIDTCYPYRAPNSILPKVIDDHDWLSFDAPVVRKDDEATKEGVLQVQAAFRTAGFTDPACDKLGIGERTVHLSPPNTPTGYLPFFSVLPIMVTTRGKRIKFETDSSDSEGNHVEQVELDAKPAPKRRKTHKLKTDDENVALSASSSSRMSKASAVPEPTQVIARRGTRGGKLRDLMYMPIDIFAEVCFYLDPHDIRRLSLTSKRLWDILMTKESRPLWKAALDAVPGLPQCPMDLNEPQYVCLMFSNECYAAGCTNRTTKTDWYHRVRYCTTCQEAKMANEWTLTYDFEFRGQFTNPYPISTVQEYFNSYSVMRHASSHRAKRGYRINEKGEKYFLVSTLEQSIAEYLGLSNIEEKREYLGRLRDEHVYRTQTGKAMLQWKSQQMADRTKDIAEGKKARFASIKAKLLELGWEEKDFPMDNKDFRDLVCKDQKLTPKIWQNVHPKLDPLLQAGRATRLREEALKRLATRKRAIRSFYHQIGTDTMDLPFKIYDLDSFMPEFEGILELPSVKPLVEEDSETVTEAQWIDVAPGVRKIVIRWWRDALKKVVNALQGEDVLPKVENSDGSLVKQEVVDNYDHDEKDDTFCPEIRTMRAQLACATSAFVSGSRWDPTVEWFPQMFRPRFYQPTIDSGIQSQRPITPDSKKLIKRILADLGFDNPETVRSEEILNDNQKKVYLCMRCDERVARYMTFSELDQAMVDEATKAIRTQPDICYPARAVDSALPQVIDDHEWHSLDAPLARKDDQATIDSVLEGQTAFKKAGLMDPECDRDGVGGEDFERHPWREIRRGCVLCPKSYAPDFTSTRRIQIHIKASVRAKLLELGWEPCDIPEGNDLYLNLVYKDQPLTPKVWQNLLERPEPLLTRSRQERLDQDRSHRLQKRKADIKRDYLGTVNEALDLGLGKLDSAASHILSPENVYSIPSIRQLLETDPEEVTEDQWAGMVCDVMMEIGKHWRRILKQLAAMTETNPSSRQGTFSRSINGRETEADIYAEILSLRSTLSLVTSSVSCVHQDCKGLIWYPEVLKHDRSSRTNVRAGDIFAHVRRPSDSLKGLVIRLLENLWLDSSSATIAKVSRLPFLLCARCDERIAPYNTFSDIVSHYSSAQEWFDSTA
ncbi:hypothetical protein FRB90_006810 [Tulasnella sp. 427]|nr:hypothetical protein FRB90_006810 [Tulasnella sp. 427]